MKHFAKIIFLYFIWLQVLYIYFGWELDQFRLFKFTLFQVGILFISFFVVYGMFKKYYKKEENKTNKLILKIIFIYIFYQIFVLFPINYFDKGAALGTIIQEIIKRFSFLLIPFIYGFVLSSFESIIITIRWINYTSIALFIIAIYNFTTDNYMLTSTGDLRVISGVSAIIFIFTFVTNLSILGAQKNNIFYIIISLLGLVFVNHRSAYLGLALILFIALYISIFYTLNFRKLLFSSVLIILLLFPISRIPYIQENFFSRVTASFDVEDPNARDRMMRWGMSFAYFLSNPINGSMLENKYYGDDEALKELYPPHNFILEILATQGLVGFIFILSIIFYIYKVFFRNRNDYISLQMFYFVTFYLFYAFFNVTFFNPWNVFMLMFCSSVILYRNKLLGL
ncbi:MAG: hypothetical protein IGBAC_0860 [Ignavibacteriae bacterium]|nr:MAG: hypothetical protein IGBAC_0860 [Ignavibacteriota bacterium]